MLPNVGHQIVHFKIAVIIGANHILYVIRLRFNTEEVFAISDSGLNYSTEKQQFHNLTKPD